MLDDRLSQRIGTTIREKWTLERLLGVGGMAAVYVGIHRIGRRDALKILHPDAAQSKEIRDRFEREARAANRFRHQGAVEIRDIDVTEDGAPFLVMEMLVGESLAERARRRGGIPLAELLSYTDQVLDTLVAAHGKGIVHRDIKPANLFVLEEGPIKILDFGLARIRQEGDQSVWTQSGMALGTTPYMPPEQARGRPIDARADLFAVGATMFRLLTGRHIHEARSDFDLLVKMGREPAPALASVAPSVPRDVCLVVDRALAFDRDQRYPEARMMLEDIRALRRRERPPHAVLFAGESDSAATTPPREAITAPVPTDSLDPSVIVPADWSASSISMESVSVEVDLEPTSPVGRAAQISGLEATKLSPTKPRAR